MWMIGYNWHSLDTVIGCYNWHSLDTVIGCYNWHSLDTVIGCYNWHSLDTVIGLVQLTQFRCYNNWFNTIDTV